MGGVCNAGEGDQSVRQSLTKGKFLPARLCMPDFTDPNIHGGNNIVQKQERPQNLSEQAQLCAHLGNVG